MTPTVTPPTARPTLAVRLVTTYGDTTRRVDLRVGAGGAVAVEAGRATPFETARLWPTVRELLTSAAPLRADPSVPRRRAEVNPPRSLNVRRIRRRHEVRTPQSST